MDYDIGKRGALEDWVTDQSIGGQPREVKWLSPNKNKQANKQTKNQTFKNQ